MYACSAYVYVLKFVSVARCIAVSEAVNKAYCTHPRHVRAKWPVWTPPYRSTCGRGSRDKERKKETVYPACASFFVVDNVCVFLCILCVLLHPVRSRVLTLRVQHRF